MTENRSYIKIATGYAIVVIALVCAVAIIYSYNKSLGEINRNEQAAAEKRGMMRKMMYSIMEMNSHEASLYIGMGRQADSYNASVDSTLAAIDSLRATLKNSNMACRLDTLKDIVAEKRKNTLDIAAYMAGRNSHGAVGRKMRDLQQGNDSLVVSANIKERGKEVVYEVNRPKKSFFGRLADAFRGSRPDTISKTEHTLPDTAGARQGINITGNVVGVLGELNDEERRNRRMAYIELTEKGRQHIRIGIELKTKMDNIIAAIEHEENATSRHDAAENTRRRTAINRSLTLLAAGAIAVAVAMLFMAWRDKRRAERYRRQREQLLLAITHDIKSPVASIAGFANLMLAEKEQHRLAEYTASISRAAQHLSHLVASLLEYFRMEREKLTPQPVCFGISELVGECVSTVRPQAGGKHIDISWQCPDVAVVADMLRIRQIIDNIIGNAVKYTDKGRIDIVCRVDAGTLAISVKDTGCGMAEADKERIFHAFTRLPSAQAAEGAGLGLSITRRLVGMLGGTIAVDSASGKGSTFTVKLPVEVKGKAAAKECAAGGGADTAGQGQGCHGHTDSGLHGSFTVVAVDDDPIQLKLLSEILRNTYGGRCTLHACTSMSKALECIHKYRPQILVTDIEMPEMGGKDLLKALDHTGMRTVAMTAHDRSIAGELEACGFDACLFKPFTPADLQRAFMRHADCTPADAFAPFTAFAEGDKEAENEILRALADDMAQHTENMKKAAAHNDRGSIAGIAHKVLPIMKMLNSGHTELFASLSPERIGSVSDKNLADTVPMAIKALEDVGEMLSERLLTYTH